MTEDEQVRLMSMATALADNSSALLRSRRWRLGNRIGRYFAPGVKRRRHELASDRLVQLGAQIDHFKATSQIPTLPATIAAQLHDWDLWTVAKPAQYAVIVLANVPWDFRNQRPQHISNTYARHGHPVFYLQIAGGALGAEQVVGDGVDLDQARSDHIVVQHVRKPANPDPMVSTVQEGAAKRFNVDSSNCGLELS